MFYYNAKLYISVDKYKIAVYNYIAIQICIATIVGNIKECKMKKRVIGTIVAFIATFIWMQLLCQVVMYETAMVKVSSESVSHELYGRIYGTLINLMCIFSVPTLFIAIYERFYREDTSWFKYIFAAAFSAAYAYFSYFVIGRSAYTHGFYHYKLYAEIILTLISVIFVMPFIWLRGYYSKINSEKAVRIKSKIDASFAANFISVLMMSVTIVVYLMLPKKEGMSWDEIVVSSEIAPVVSNILSVYVTIVGGIVFLFVYESNKEGKGVIKYVQWFFSQFFVLLFIFNLMDTHFNFIVNMRSAAIFTAFSLIPVMVCLITELKGRSLTKAIVAGIKPQGDRVKPERLTEVRRTARSCLGGSIFAGGWLMMMLVGIIYGALSGFVAVTVIGAILVVGPITYGLAKAEMNVVTGKKEQADLADLFAGFSENFSQAVVLKLLQNIFLGLWSMLFIIPGVVKSYSYAMSFYVQQQAENKNWRYALRESNRLMYGNRFKLFLLDLSFIGWYILGSMCLGIGFLFVIPYHRTARAAFFNSLLVADKKMKEEKLNAEAVTVAETEFAALTDTVASNESEETA